ncbi:MAG: hypothetical protein RUMPE_00129 [Eubacteriales bacterium SKADARSKE-1]|nr:hypothetical protein [Eubacteriales bacterium SKADARSKE-1]
MSGFKEVDVNSLNENVFKLIGEKWMLITAGDKDKLNMMTASWGGFGVLWNKNVTFAFIRPQRYTFGLVEKNDYYTLSFYDDDKYRDELSFCGTNSGKDINKTEKISFTPAFDKAPYFKEAKLVFVCKKIYGQFILPECFIDESLGSNYPNKDYHKVFVGEIEKVLIKE